MIIKENKGKPSSFLHQISTALKLFSKFTARPIPVIFNFKKVVALILVTILVWSLLLTVVIYRQSHTPGFEELARAFDLKGRDVKHKASESFKVALVAPFRWARANLSDQMIPRFNIDIKFKDIQRLRSKREDALNSGMLVKAENDYVPGKIRFKGESYKIKTRLKGDWTDHLEGDKWSLRIHVKGDNHLLGMRRFSIQHPRTRNFESEILFFEALKKEGILAPRYFFVEVFVNGKNIGLMALEEHFSKELLESQRRREGIIVRFNEDLFWESLRFDQYKTTKLFDNFKTAQITPFRSNKVARSKQFSADLALAKNLVKGFVRGYLKPSQVFDPDLMGKFIAVADVWGATHMLRWHNLRFYYNPITALLEPIGFDADLLEDSGQAPLALEEPIVSAIIDGDPAIKLVYQETVEKLVKEMEEGTAEKWFQSLAKKQLALPHKEFPFLNGIRFEQIARRGREVLTKSQPPVNDYPEVLQVSSIHGGDGLYLELINPLSQAIEIRKIYCTGESIEKNNLRLDVSVEFPLNLNPTFMGDLPDVKKIPYELFQEDLKCDIALTMKIAGEERLRSIQAVVDTPVLKEQVLPDFDLQETLALHSFVKYFEDEKKLKVLPGDWQVSGWIVVPNKVTLEIARGTTLRFDKTSGLLANGPVNIKGTLEEPVVLTGRDSLSGMDTWFGIALLKTQNFSVWSHVEILNTSGINKDGWVLSGGVNFYESNIKMDHVLFSGNNAEDALNVVRSKFELKSVTIKNTTSDAFDSDFSSGTVQNSVFENIGSQGGGDGIDVSGSEVVVTASNFKNISDKALSVGEGSNLRASGINVEQADIGAASKDGSRLFLSDSRFSGIKKAGLMVYVKKPVYGPAEITAKALEFHSTKIQAMAQKGNKISIDGKLIPPVFFNVKELYVFERMP